MDHLHEKIDVLEGVVNELHAQQEEHEMEHAGVIQKGQKGDTNNIVERTDQSVVQPTLDERLTTVLLIIASNKRPEYLEKTLQYVKEYHPK